LLHKETEPHAHELFTLLGMASCRCKSLLRSHNVIICLYCSTSALALSRQFIKPSLTWNIWANIWRRLDLYHELYN